MRNADVPVFRFPFWWGSASAMLKSWLDTFMLGFLENPGMKGKSLLVATATGVGEEEYRAGGAEQFTTDKILRPYQVTSIYSGMTCLRPFVLYGTMMPDAERRIRRGAEAFRTFIESLRLTGIVFHDKAPYFRTSTGLCRFGIQRRNLPVTLSGFSATSVGVPVATIRPPSAPPPGPRSTM